MRFQDLMYRGFCREKDSRYCDYDNNEEIILNGEKIIGRWLYGDRLEDMIAEEVIDTYNSSGEYYGMSQFSGFVPVVPATIGICTPYKDKNNKSIFVDDRISCHILATGKTFTGVVRFGEYRRKDGSEEEVLCGFYIDWDEDLLNYNKKSLPYWAGRVQVLGWEGNS